MIGKQIEGAIGSWFFAMSYMLCGLLGSVASALLTTGNSAGASGAILA